MKSTVDIRILAKPHCGFVYKKISYGRIFKRDILDPHSGFEHRLPSPSKNGARGTFKRVRTKNDELGNKKNPEFFEIAPFFYERMTFTIEKLEQFLGGHKK